MFSYNLTPDPFKNFALLSKDHLGLIEKSNLSNLFFLNFFRPAIAIIAALSLHKFNSGKYGLKFSEIAYTGDGIQWSPTAMDPTTSEDFFKRDFF